MSEVKARFVDASEFTASATRSQIWGHWLQAKDTLKAVVPIHAAWIGGSFTTEKLDPDDLDVVFIVNQAAVAAIADPAGQRLIQAFAEGEAFHKPARRLDTFILGWRPIAEPGLLRPVEQEDYYTWRGHWDDFWQRQRSGAKNDPITNGDAIPRRGYLEVRLGGYTV